jgi:hypothetical protein
VVATPMTNEQQTRAEELYRRGLEEYHRLMDFELGENNAVIAAVAAISAAMEERLTWKLPRITVPDDGPEDDDSYGGYGPRRPDQQTKQLPLSLDGG